jgi:plastocyanin
MSASLLDSGDPPRLARGRAGRRVVAVLVLLIAVAGCGDDDAAGELPADYPDVAESEYQDMTGQDSVTIDARDNTFSPRYVVISPGTEVTFANVGRNPHNAIAVQAGAFVDVPTNELQPGDSASRTFDSAGDYPYYCSLHATPTRGMTGRIRVAEE